MLCGDWHPLVQEEVKVDISIEALAYRTRGAKGAD